MLESQLYRRPGSPASTPLASPHTPPPSEEPAIDVEETSDTGDTPELSPRLCRLASE